VLITGSTADGDRHAQSTTVMERKDSSSMKRRSKEAVIRMTCFRGCRWWRSTGEQRSRANNKSRSCPCRHVHWPHNRGMCLQALIGKSTFSLSSVPNTSEGHLQSLSWIRSTLRCRHTSMRTMQWSRYRHSTSPGLPGDVYQHANDVSDIVHSLSSDLDPT
jgi:hypothetical protein